MLFDSHAHLNFSAYKNDGEEVIERTLKQGVFFVNVGSDFKTSERAVRIAEKYEKGIYAAVGCHPIHVSGDVEESVFNGTEEKTIRINKENVDFEAYRRLAGLSKKVVAIGEIGLDYYRIPEGIDAGEAKNKQENILSGFIDLSKELDLPIILHARGETDRPYDVYDDLYEAVKKVGIYRGVVHCFGGDLNQAEKFMALGFYIGITGIITFKNSSVLREIVKELPLDALLIETDSPYLAPDPFRGQRNEPLNVREVARKVAEIRGIGPDVVGQATFNSTLALFGISI